MFNKSDQVFAKRKKQSKKVRKGLRKGREHKSYSLFIFIFIRPLVILFCIVSIYAIYSSETRWFEKLDRTPIEVYGLTHKLQFTTDTDIRDALVTGSPMKGYFGQDVKQIEKKLLAIPWVRSVVVRKVWPNKLSLTLFEHNPIALWNDTKLLSDRGVVFNLPFDRVNRSGFPILYGPETEGKKVLNAWGKIKQDLIVRNLILQSVAIDSRGSWKITLSNGIQLLLGRGDWLPKIDRFVKIFPKIDVPKGKMISYVDLRYKYGAAVGFVLKNK